METTLLESLATILLDSMWLAPLIALLAGIITAFTPCCLVSVPLIMGYVGGVSEKSYKKSFTLTLYFSLGMVIVSTILGVIIALIGSMFLFTFQGSWWYLVLGIFMILMSLQVVEFIELIPSTFLTNRVKYKGKLGAFLVGMLAGLFSSPCSTPILVALLTIVAQKGDLLWGTILLLLYSVGHSVVFIIAGTSTTFVKKIMHGGKYTHLTHIIKWGTGLVILIIGVLLVWLGL